MNNEMNNNTPNVNDANNNLTNNAEPIVNEVPNQPDVTNQSDVPSQSEVPNQYQSINNFNNNVNVASNPNNTLLEDNIDVEKKNGKMPILIVIGVLLVILIGIAIYMFFFNNKNLSSKDVYYNALDGVNSYLVGNVNNIKDENTKMTHDLAFNIVSSDTDSKEVINVLNKRKIERKDKRNKLT